MKFTRIVCILAIALCGFHVSGYIVSLGEKAGLPMPKNSGLVGISWRKSKQNELGMQPENLDHPDLRV